MLVGCSMFCGGADELRNFFIGSVLLYCQFGAFSCQITRVVMGLSVEDL